MGNRGRNLCPVVGHKLDLTRSSILNTFRTIVLKFLKMEFKTEFPIAKPERLEPSCSKSHVMDTGFLFLNGKQRLQLAPLSLKTLCVLLISE